MDTKADKQAKIIIRIVVAVIILVIAVFIILSCKGPEKSKRTGYLVAIETIQPRDVTVHKLRNPENVDSIVVRNYGYAITGFNSDTLFHYSPYFRIETLNKIVYGEEKELIQRNGKTKLRKLKK